MAFVRGSEVHQTTLLAYVRRLSRVNYAITSGGCSKWSTFDLRLLKSPQNEPKERTLMCLI